MASFHNIVELGKASDCRGVVKSVDCGLSLPQTKEPLAKFPVRERGIVSITAYPSRVRAGFENPLRGSAGTAQNNALLIPWE